jgi:inosine/guanosine/xanthosine phosphorylase family protein
MSTHKTILESAKVIKKLAPNFKPKFGIILGSGLGPLAKDITDQIEIPYAEIPGYPVSTVKGHASKLILGKLAGVPIVCMDGRVHMYEGTSTSRIEKLKILIRMAKVLGCHSLLSTSAVGSLHKEMGPGQLCTITDHINLQGFNPLAGPNDGEFGSRFVTMNNAYSPQLREKLHAAADKLNIPLYDGVYVACLGPTFETPAEIRAFHTLGADVVGMSTVPETIIARHCGLNVVTVSVIVNLAAGLSDVQPSHDETLHYANIASENLCTLLNGFFKNNAEEFRK